MRLAQYVEVAAATRPELEQHLRSAFDREPVPEPTSLHEFIAAIRRLAREHDRPPPAQILVTTNYDDALERAFEREGEPYDLLWYTTVSGGEGGEREGFFMHRPPSGVPVRYSRPNEDTSVNPNERPVILKLHGAVHRDRCASDSYVISEDDYIDYLGFIDVDALPLLVKQDMAERSYLFLGYGLGDWNLNVLLRRVWARRGPRSKLWAVQRSIADLDKQVWSCRHVEVFPADLTRWVEHVRNALVAALGEAP